MALPTSFFPIHPERSLLPLASGLLLALAFPCNPAMPLAFLFHGIWAGVALLPLLFSLTGGTFKEGFRRGWLSGFVYNLIGLYWVAYTQGGGPAVIGGTALMALYLGIFTGVFGGCLHRLRDRWGPRAILAAPFLWTALEYLLSLGELGFPWLLLGHSQAVFPGIVQYAAFTGVYGVTFWLITLNVLLFVCLGVALPAWRRWAALALIPALLVPWLYSRAVIQPHQGSTVRIGLVQSNMGLEKWQPGGLERSFVRLADLSRQAAAQTPSLLVWPETALPCHVAQSPTCNQRLRRMVDDLQIPVLTGSPDYDPRAGEAYNAAFMVSPGTDELVSYAKMHLVPFGERTPFKDSLPLLRDIDWSALTGDLGSAEFARGKERTLFAHPQAPFAVLICFESVFPDLVRRSVKAGARILVNITNDSWFGRTAGPYQHAQLAVLRAIENRTAVARCATSGISMFIDPFGRVSQATDIYVPTAVVGDLPLNEGGTFYTRYGDIFAQVVLLITSLGLIWSRWVTPSRQHEPSHKS